MTKTLVQHAKVRTNTVKDSVCKVDVPAVKFSDLWDHYVTGDPYKPGPNEGDYGNQCALRMSATFHKVGVKMLSFSQKIVKPMPGAKELGRVMLDGYPAASRAYELDEWLKLQPFCGLPKQPEDVTGKDWETKVKGRTGIIQFHGYWTRGTAILTCAIPRSYFSGRCNDSTIRDSLAFRRSRCGELVGRWRRGCQVMRAFPDAPALPFRRMRP